MDLGPNWIHGTEHNPILDLAKQTNTPTHTWDASSNVFGEDGRLLKEGASLMEAMWNIVVHGFKHSAKNTSTIDPEASLHDFFSEKVLEFHPGPGEAELRRKVVMQMSELWGAFVGSPVTTQSLKFFWLEECLDGGESSFTFEEPPPALSLKKNTFIKLHVCSFGDKSHGRLQVLQGLAVKTQSKLKKLYFQCVVEWK